VAWLEAGLRTVADTRVAAGRLAAAFAVGRLEAAFAAGFADACFATGFAAADGVPVVEAAAAPVVAGRLVDAGRLAALGRPVVLAAGCRVVAGFRTVAGLAAEAAFVAAIRFIVVARDAAAADVLMRTSSAVTGETASAAWIAAVPTRFTTPLTASPTSPAADPAAAAVAPAAAAVAPAADPAADAVAPAILETSDATSLAASAACFWRLATSLRPFEPCAAASCPSRFVSVARASARRFSSLRSSFTAFSRLPMDRPPFRRAASATVRAGRQVCHVPWCVRSRYPPPMPLVLIGLGGFAGAISRYLVDGFVSDRTGGGFPWGTLVVNATGSFVLGLLFAATTERAILPAELRGPLMIGFIGAYTTFSTFMLESWGLIESGSYGPAIANLGGSVAVGLTAVAAGLILGRAI
jgi:fluoride exporter